MLHPWLGYCKQCRRAHWRAGILSDQAETHSVYKFPSKHCFCWSPHTDKLYFHLVQNNLKISWDFFLWPVCYLEIGYLISKYFGNFPAIFLLLISSLIQFWSESRIHYIYSFKQEKEYIKAVYCHPAYLTSMQSTSWETLGWKKHKLESDCWEKYQ